MVIQTNGGVRSELELNVASEVSARIIGPENFGGGSVGIDVSTRHNTTRN